MYENCAGGLLDALVLVQYMHVLYVTCGVVVVQLFYGKWFAFDRSLWWQANQSMKTISIYRRTGGNRNWGAVLVQPVRVSAFPARGSVIVSSPPQYSSVVPNSAGPTPAATPADEGGRRVVFGVAAQARKCGCVDAAADGARWERLGFALTSSVRGQGLFIKIAKLKLNWFFLIF